MSDNEACLFALLGMDMEVLPAVLRVDWELQTRHHRSWWSDPSCIWWQTLRVWKLDHDLRRKCKVSYWCNVFSYFLLKVGRATWKCSSWQVLWRGWRRRKEAKGQRSPMRPAWESRKWSFLVLSCSFPPSPSSASWAPPQRSTTWWRWWRWCRRPLSGRGWSL